MEDIRAAIDQRSAPRGHFTVLVLDPLAIDWTTFPLGCALPGIDVGQNGDRRYRLPDGRGLHVHDMPGNVVHVHIDSADPCSSLEGAAKHVARDTKAVAGALAGGCLGLVLLGGFGAAIGAALGAVVGGNAPARRPFYVQVGVPDWHLATGGLQ